MKKTVLCIGTCVLCVVAQPGARAHSRATIPWSQVEVATAGSVVGLATGFLTKLIVSNPPDSISIGVGGNGFLAFLRTRLSPLSDKWSMVVASVVGLVAAGITWKCLSSRTARGYAHAAQDILSGEKCSQPEVLDFVQRCAGSAQVLSDVVVNYFAAQKNELVKAANALEELSEQLSLARYYFVVAQKGCSGSAADLFLGFQEIIEQQLEVIKEASLIIKAFPDFARQSTAEIQEMSMHAQFATANAIQSAAYASHVNYNYSLN
jgi:hypothetical protein